MMEAFGTSTHMAAQDQSHIRERPLFSKTSASSAPTAVPAKHPPTGPKAVSTLEPFAIMKNRTLIFKNPVWKALPSKQVFMAKQIAKKETAAVLAPEDKNDYVEVTQEDETADIDRSDRSQLPFNTTSTYSKSQQLNTLPLRLSPGRQARKGESLGSPTTNATCSTTMSCLGSNTTEGHAELRFCTSYSLNLIPPSNAQVQSLTQFMNANLIQQKRLKANNSQISKAANDFDNLKLEYKSCFTVPPTTTTAARAQMYSQLRQLCSRYDGLLKIRREMLEKQQAWLEQALIAPEVKDSEQLGLAIDMQIVAARDLAALQEERGLKRELEMLMQSN